MKLARKLLEEEEEEEEIDEKSSRKGNSVKNDKGLTEL